MREEIHDLVEEPHDAADEPAVMGVAVGAQVLNRYQLRAAAAALIIWHWFSLDTNMCIVYNQITTQNNNRGAL